MGKNEEARPLLASLLTEHPDEARIVYECGKLALEDDRLTEAEALLRRAHAKNPFDVQMMYTFQQCLMRCGKQDEAKALLDRLGKVDADQKKLFELTKVVVESAHAPVERAEAGFLCLQLGMLNHALTMFRLGLHDDPENLRALEGLAEYYRLTGKPEVATRYRARAEELRRVRSGQQKKP